MHTVYIICSCMTVAGFCGAYGIPHRICSIFKLLLLKIDMLMNVIHTITIMTVTCQ